MQIFVIGPLMIGMLIDQRLVKLQKSFQIIVTAGDCALENSSKLIFCRKTHLAPAGMRVIF